MRRMPARIGPHYDGWKRRVRRRRLVHPSFEKAAPRRRGMIASDRGRQVLLVLVALALLGIAIGHWWRHGQWRSHSATTWSTSIHSASAGRSMSGCGCAQVVLEAVAGRPCSSCVPVQLLVQLVPHATLYEARPTWLATLVDSPLGDGLLRRRSGRRVVGRRRSQRGWRGRIDGRGRIQRERRIGWRANAWAAGRRVRQHVLLDGG